MSRKMEFSKKICNKYCVSARCGAEIASLEYKALKLLNRYIINNHWVCALNTFMKKKGTIPRFGICLIREVSFSISIFILSD